MNPRETAEDAVEIFDRDRCVPVEEDAGQVGHEDPELVAVDTGPEIRRPDRGGERRAARREPGLAEVRPIVCRPGDPVAGERVALEDESVAAAATQATQRRARPAVIRKW